MILLDTNICIHIINAKPAAVLQRFNGYRIGKIGICSVVAAELSYGVAKSGSDSTTGFPAHSHVNFLKTMLPLPSLERGLTWWLIVSREE